MHVQAVDSMVTKCVGLNINPFLASAMEKEARAQWMAEAEERARASIGSMLPPPPPVKTHPMSSNVAMTSTKPPAIKQPGDYLVATEPCTTETTIQAEGTDVN